MGEVTVLNISIQIHNDVEAVSANCFIDSRFQERAKRRSWKQLDSNQQSHDVARDNPYERRQARRTARLPLHPHRSY